MFQTKAEGWGIPRSNVTHLTAANSSAKNILAFVKSGLRTPASVVQCGEIFREPETEARYIKKHWLISPPLTAADLALLLIGPGDETKTPAGPPKGQPLLSAFYPGGPHVLGLRTGPLPGTQALDTRGDYGYAIYKGVMPQGGATLEQAASARHY